MEIRDAKVYFYSTTQAEDYLWSVMALMKKVAVGNAAFKLVYISEHAWHHVVTIDEQCVLLRRGQSYSFIPTSCAVIDPFVSLYSFLYSLTIKTTYNACKHNM